MASKKNRSSWAKEKAQFNAQLGGFDALDDVFAREDSRHAHLAEERDSAQRYKACESKNRYATLAEAQENLAWCQKQAKEFLPYICDTGNYLDTALSSGKQMVLEAQLGAMRDIDYGIFPYTSSSTTIAAYGPIGAGIPGVQPDHVVGVLKAYSTCVGAGPFVAENAMPEEWKESLRKAGGEYGAATGRPRRVGPFDAVASRYGLKCQRADKIALTKLDVLSYMQEIPIITGYLYKGKETDTFVPTENLEEYQPVISFIPGWKQDISACRRWEELPDAAKNYIKTLEKLLDHEIQFISVGAKREEYLIKGEWL